MEKEDVLIDFEIFNYILKPENLTIIFEKIEFVLFNEDFSKNLEVKYLLFQKKSNKEQKDTDRSFLNHLFINFFYLDSFFTNFIKNKEEYAWILKLIEALKRSDKRNAKNMDNSFNFFDPAKEFLKVSRFNKIPTNFDHFLLLEELINEMHTTREDLSTLDCTYCKNFNIKRRLTENKFRTECYLDVA